MIEAIRRILSAYRRDDYADPDSFNSQLGVILERYPPCVVEHISHPLTGIQRKSVFPPSIAEIVKACDDRLAYEIALERVKASPRKVQVDVMPSPEEQERVGAKLRALLNDLRPGSEFTGS